MRQYMYVKFTAHAVKFWNTIQFSPNYVSFMNNESKLFLFFYKKKKKKANQK